MIFNVVFYGDSKCTKPKKSLKNRENHFKNDGKFQNAA